MQIFVTFLVLILTTSSFAFPTHDNSSAGLLNPGQAINCTSKDHTGCVCEMSDGSGVIDLRSIGYTNNEPRSCSEYKGHTVSRNEYHLQHNFHEMDIFNAPSGIPRADDNAVTSTLMIASDISYRFKDFLSSDGAKYSYNPCYGFTEGKCINSAVCMTHGKSMLSIGQADDVTMQYAPDLRSVVTTYFTNQTIVLEAEVVLICDPNACTPSFDPVGVKAMGFYLFRMTSVCACPGMCTSSGAITCKSSSGQLRDWTILCLGSSVVVAVFILCVMMFNKIRSISTRSDVIPRKKSLTDF